MQEVHIYIDGSCSGNPGPIGWSAVCEIDGKVRASCGFNSNPKCTNNQAELRGLNQGLSALRQPCIAVIHTDSTYLITSVRHGDAWLKEEGRANRDLWLQVIEQVKKGGHKVKFVKVKGHSGDRLNELADKLAKAECAKARHELRLKGV